MYEKERRRLQTVCSLLLILQPQVLLAFGRFELQIKLVQNLNGVLANGECCDGGPGEHSPQCQQDQCDTYFQVCLKEYQLRVTSGGSCILGSGVTPVLGGNTFSFRHNHHGNQTGRIVIPFYFAWPRSFSLILEAWDLDNDTANTAGTEQLIERATHSGMLNPGDQWQTLRHPGWAAFIEYKIRVRCEENYYSSGCNKLCRPRNDFVGHHSCDRYGDKVCLEGWTGEECTQAICKQGCHPTLGYCRVPGECKCYYGWQGSNCDECIPFPGCVHGICSEPWKCVCETNWGGLLCDKDLNYCGSHQPCLNGGTCANTEPDKYQCICEEGFHGQNCQIAEHACLSSPCLNGGTCTQTNSGFQCVCAAGWSGPTCTDDIDECASSPCAHDGTCRNLADGFACTCPSQWTGKTCQLDTNECEWNPCVHAQTCKNLIGGYFCECRSGWTGQNCDKRKATCPVVCRNGGRCQESGSGHVCHCLPNYTGSACESKINECASAPCLHGGHCEELVNGFHCRCPLGFMGTHCESQFADKTAVTLPAPAVHSLEVTVDHNEIADHSHAEKFASSYANFSAWLRSAISL
ncbi:protein jagged-1 [Latimeria chalumnae]|uniref:protein jagged-1 n=1 Tax=Latimeria chalumnae TaxID=7897 RepID=UPI00313D25EB